MNLKTSKLGDVCDIRSGNSIPAKEKDALYRNVGEGLPYVATKDISFDGSINFENGVRIPAKFAKKFRLSKKNSVLVCAEGGSAGRKIAYSNQDCYFVNKLFSIKPTTEIDSKYIYFYTLSNEFQKKFKESLHGLIGGVSLSKIKNFQITYPSLEEQQRIVAKLDEAFAEIDKTIQLTEKKIIEIERFCAQALTSIYFDKKNKSLKKLNEIVSIKGGKRLPKGKKLTTENTGFPYIRVSDFNDDGTINLKSVKFIEADVQKQIERYTISSKDVYVSIAGTIGKTGIVPEILENANLTENAVKLIPHESVDKEFLYFFTKTTSFKKQAIKQTRTAAQPKLALERLGKVEIPLFDLKKQIKIISEARNIILWMKLTKENCYNKIEHLVKLKSAILIQKLRPKKAA